MKQVIQGTVKYDNFFLFQDIEKTCSGANGWEIKNFAADSKLPSSKYQKESSKCRKQEKIAEPHQNWAEIKSWVWTKY